MFSGLLRHEQEARDDEGREDCRGIKAAKREPAVVNWLVEQIAQCGAQRPREDESAPEQHSARDLCIEIPPPAIRAKPAVNTSAPRS